MGASLRRCCTRLLAVSALGIAAGLVAFAWRFHVRSWRDVEICWMMSRECHPVWKDLFLERVTAGDDVEEVIVRTRPLRIQRFGRYVLLSYEPEGQGLPFSGMTILARDGRLVGACAWSCTWYRVFFDTQTEEDRRGSSAAYDEYVQELVRKRQQDPPNRPPAP